MSKVARLSGAAEQAVSKRLAEQTAQDNPRSATQISRFNIKPSVYAIVYEPLQPVAINHDVLGAPLASGNVLSYLLQCLIEERAHEYTLPANKRRLIRLLRPIRV